MIDICDIQDKINLTNQLTKSIDGAFSVRPLPTRNFIEDNKNQRVIVVTIVKGDGEISIVFDLENSIWYFAAPVGRQIIGSKFDLSMNNDEFSNRINSLNSLFL